MNSGWNPPNTDGVLPPPQPQAAPAPAPAPAGGAPTPEQVAQDVAARQAVIDAQKSAGQVPLDPAGDPDGAKKAAEAAAAAEAQRRAERAPVPGDSRQRFAAPASLPSDPAEAAARQAAIREERQLEPAPAPGVASPLSADPASQAPRGYQATPKPTRTPKYLLGAHLSIPGGFGGRVVKVFRTYEEMASDPTVAAAGLDRVLRGRNGTSTPSTQDQPFYQCRSNRFDYDLVVGELDAQLVQQGTGAPQE